MNNYNYSCGYTGPMMSPEHPEKMAKDLLKLAKQQNELDKVISEQIKIFATNDYGHIPYYMEKFRRVVEIEYPECLALAEELINKYMLLI